MPIPLLLELVLPELPLELPELLLELGRMPLLLPELLLLELAGPTLPELDPLVTPELELGPPELLLPPPEPGSTTGPLLEPPDPRGVLAAGVGFPLVAPPVLASGAVPAVGLTDS